MSALPSWVKNIGIVVTVILIVLGVATAFREGCATVTKPLAPPGPSYQKDSPPLPLKGSGRADVLPVPAPRAPAYFPPRPPALPRPQDIWGANGELVFDWEYNEGDRLITLTPEHPSITLPYPMPCRVRWPNTHHPIADVKATEHAAEWDCQFNGDPRPIGASKPFYLAVGYLRPLVESIPGDMVQITIYPN